MSAKCLLSFKQNFAASLRHTNSPAESVFDSKLFCGRLDWRTGEFWILHVVIHLHYLGIIWSLVTEYHRSAFACKLRDLLKLN